MRNQSNDFIIDLFLANYQLFKKTQMNDFSWSLYLRKFEILKWLAVVLEKKRKVRKNSFGISEILEDPFLSEFFENVSVVHYCSRL